MARGNTHTHGMGTRAGTVTGIGAEMVTGTGAGMEWGRVERGLGNTLHYERKQTRRCERGDDAYVQPTTSQLGDI